MALRAVKPSTIEKRLKALFYGSAGVGKTTAAISFPKPYLIDTEKGASNEQYVRLLEKSGGVIFQTSDFEEVLSEIISLLSIKHEFKTLIIDPLTIIYDDLLDKSEEQVGSDFGRHYNIANKKIKHLLNLLVRLDMNVIITSHAKNEYAQVKNSKGKSEMIIKGQTFDCYKKLDYLFDLVFEIQKRGVERVGVIKKTRMDSFLEGEQFPFSYENIAQKYGKTILEKDAIPIDLASKDQIMEINRLIEVMKIPEEIYQKWLDKGEAENFSEMTSEFIQKCIDALNKKLTTKGE